MPLLATYLGAPVVWVPGGLVHKLGWPIPRDIKAVIGWGLRPSTKKARAFAEKNKLPYVCLEDGFLRSYGTGDHFPPLSLVLDETGIFYDKNRPSDLENALNSSINFCDEENQHIVDLRKKIVDLGLSKYNHAPLFAATLTATPAPFTPVEPSAKVLVIDQTVGDMSVIAGGGDASTFHHMLATARSENLNATIYIKTHPEVSSGRKQGYLTSIQSDPHTVVVRDLVNPISLLNHMHKVYVVSSTMGFEALLAGKPVACFGVPWYAGWGVTDDRQTISRRARKRSVDELFAAAFIHYTRYINPVTYQLGQLNDVVEWLTHQRLMAQSLFGEDGKSRVIGLGFAHWKAYNLKPILGLQNKQVHFVSNTQSLTKLKPQATDTIVVWGAEMPVLDAVKAIKDSDSATYPKIVHMEDGFVRSVGLGSDMIRPMSIVLDQQGIYFDATRSSDLEHLLATATFEADELVRAKNIRKFIVQHGITKYNTEPRQAVSWPSKGRRILLVPGQVQDDSSIRLGCTTVRTNKGLLQAVRSANPEAFIVYKPHPDVLSGNRLGKLHVKEATFLADYIETRASIVDCIDACDALHTLTSLSGFDALLRGKQVVTYGQPFYAGWLLTQDLCVDGDAFKRRGRHLSLDELVSGVLLRYPIYWDWALNGYTTCEAVLHRIVEQRAEMASQPSLNNKHSIYIKRQLGKLNVLVKAWIAHYLMRTF